MLVSNGKLYQYKGITGLDTDLKLNKPQLKVNIDRDKASSLGVSMNTVASTIETLLVEEMLRDIKKMENSMMLLFKWKMIKEDSQMI